MEKMKMRKHIALFAGLGGFIAAANRAASDGHANDNNIHCYNTLKTTYPEIQITNQNNRTSARPRKPH